MFQMLASMELEAYPFWYLWSKNGREVSGNRFRVFLEKRGIRYSFLQLSPSFASPFSAKYLKGIFFLKEDLFYYLLMCICVCMNMCKASRRCQVLYSLSYTWL